MLIGETQADGDRLACQICGNEGLGQDNFCMICGADQGRPPIVGERSRVFYKSLKVNENGKALVCPHCDNEELTQGEYCMICGSNIINRCADTPDKNMPGVVVKSCRDILSGNARYCPKCGNESTFYQRGWLRDWRSENTRRAIENINLTVELVDLQGERSSG